MDRTSEYNKLITITSTDIKKPQPTQTFYDTLYIKLITLEQNLANTKKYVEILVLEEKFHKLVSEIHDIIHMIDIDMNSDEEKHYEGIKYILNYRVNIIEKNIKYLKFNSSKIKVELEPETSTNIKKHDNFNVNQQIEQEHAKLVERFVDTSVQCTIQRVLEIQEIQDLIGMHLTAQSERIELLCVTTRDAKRVVRDSSGFVAKDNGRYARRLLFLILLSMSFVLIFMHFYHKP